MHESRCNEHTGAEMAGQEERIVRDWQLRESPDDYREGAGKSGEDEDQEEREDVQRSVVSSR